MGVCVVDGGKPRWRFLWGGGWQYLTGDKVGGKGEKGEKN